MSKSTGYYIYKLRDLIRQKSDDSGFSNRLLFSVIKTEANDFIKQELDKKRLLRGTDFQTLDCVKLEKSSLKVCCGIDLDTCLMRSIDPIPSLLEANSGPAIQGIYPIDGSLKIFYGTRNDMLRKLKRDFLSPNGQAFIENGILYLYNLDIEAVKITAFFRDPEEVSVMNECRALGGNCNDTQLLSCLNYLELDYPIPSYLENDILLAARDRFLIQYLKLPIDEENDSKE